MGDASSSYSPSLLDGATESFSGWEPKKLWRTDPHGGRSEECAWTEGFDSRSDGRSLVASDLDGDGDVDLLMLNRNGPRLQLFRNDGEVGNAVTLRFEPASGVRDAANVKVRVDGRAEEVLLQRGFASSVPPELTRGLGERSSAQVEVTWRSGKTQRFEAKAGQVTTLSEKTGTARATAFAPRTPRPPARFPSSPGALGLEPTGTQTLVTLFLAGCAPCRKEAPALNALAAGGTRVIGLGVAADDEAAVPIARALGFTFEARALPAWAAEALSTNGQLDFPTTLVFSPDGSLERVVSDVQSLKK
jgi:hypothetical protein